MALYLIGSLGLFLLGMWMLTEGLKLAGGRALEHLLSQWTSSRSKGLVAGVFITSLVQSSSAVTVATIGFVNAKLMTFQRAVWVVFGSNLGTTFTAWIITLVGFNFKLDAYTFPLIGIGAFLRLLAPREKYRALGMALAGFGLLFLGIDSLKNNFAEYAYQLDIANTFTRYQYPTLVALILGIILTVLTQSSSAAIAIILSAVASGIVGMHEAAAAVIGANVGTTSTAILASIGATANAKRLALAHVIFNLLTAIVALALLPLLWFLVADQAVAPNTNAALQIAIFHTSFNLFGVLLIWPLEPRLSKWLLSLYKHQSQSPLIHLDANVASVPEIATRALTVELELVLKNFAKIKFSAGVGQISNELSEKPLIDHLNAIDQFIAMSLKSELTQQQGHALTLSLSVSHHLKNALTSYQQATEKTNHLAYFKAIPETLNHWLNTVNQFNHNAIFETQLATTEPQIYAQQLEQFKQDYQQIKSQLLAAAAEHKYELSALDLALQTASLARRFSEQISQTLAAFAALLQLINNQNVDNNQAQIQQNRVQS